MIPSGMLTILSINLTIESNATNGDGAIRSRILMVVEPLKS